MPRFMGFVRMEENIGMPPQGLMDAMDVYIGEQAAKGVFLDGGGLYGTEDAVNFVVRQGEVTRVDGPYAEGKEVVPYLVGRKAVSYYKFRKRDYAAEWTVFSDAPTFENAKEIADRITADFLKDTEEGGNDEIHVVFTRFRSMVRQDPHVLRLLPL